MSKIKFLIAVILLLSATQSQAQYVPKYVNMTVDVSIQAYRLVKASTTAGHVTTLLHTDSAALMVGITQSACNIGAKCPILAVQGVASYVISDGTTTIASGDLIDVSSTVDGQVMKAAGSPTADSQTICSALSAAAATPGTALLCL